ncbi:hypothetical protein CR513_45212, partial [Mucuna pruriens]
MQHILYLLVYLHQPWDNINLTFHKSAKYIEIDCHLVRDKFQVDIIHPLPITYTKSINKHSY